MLATTSRGAVKATSLIDTWTHAQVVTLYVQYENEYAVHSWGTLTQVT